MKESRIAGEVHMFLEKIRTKRVFWLGNGVYVGDVVCGRDKDELHIVKVLINFILNELDLLNGFFLISQL